MYKVPDFISAHVYMDADGGRIIYIFNHKTNEYIVLDGISAVIYEIFLNGSSYVEVENYVYKNNLETEINDFMEELLNLGLLFNSDLKRPLICDNKLKNISIDKQNAFRTEMFDFMRKNNYLERIFLEMTYNCNLNCIHCFNDKTRKGRLLRFEEIKKVIDEAYELGVFYITMSGGECTLNPDLLKIIKHIRKKRIAFELYTNGQLLYDNKELLKKIIGLFPYRIALSLYSMKSEIHDKITGVQGSLSKTLNVIKILKENNINVDIKCFLTKLNFDCYKEVVDYAKENNFSLTLDYKLLINPSNSNQNIRITQEQIFNLYTDKSSFFYIKNIKPHNICKQFLEERICGGGSTSLLVDPELGLYICPSLKIPLGSLRKNSIKDIWQDKDSTSVFNKFKLVKKSNLKECYKNDYCKYCLYCPGIAFMANSYMKKHNNYCEESKIMLKAAEFADNEEDL